MAHSVVLKLNKPANEFPAGDGIGFSVRGGVQYFDHKTKQKEWTNYSAVIFAKAQGQIDFYRSALVEGAIVEVGGKTQKVDVYEGGANGPSYTIELLDAWLGSINNPAQQQSQPAQNMQQPAQGGYAQQPQQPQQRAQQPNQGYAQQSSGAPQPMQQAPMQGNNAGFQQPQR
mgnify:CR=1 FL=1